MDVKKNQQNAKKLVNAFGKEVLSWYHLNDQILMLLEALLKCTLVGLTISSYYASESENSDLLDCIVSGSAKTVSSDSMQPELSLSNRSIFSLFPDLLDRLKAQFLLEREDYCCQIKKILNYLGDVVVAMQLTGSEVMSLVYNQSPALWTDEENMFGVEHMLDIIDLHGMFLCEFRRKQLIIQSMLRQLEHLEQQVSTTAIGSHPFYDAASSNSAEQGERYVQLIKHAIGQWSSLQMKTNENMLNLQDSENSWCCVDNTRLLAFLEANNVKTD